LPALNWQWYFGRLRFCKYAPATYCIIRRSRSRAVQSFPGRILF
jgi:hypothetical protein